MSSGEMGSSFKRHTHCAKRSVQGVTCLYFSIEGVFIAGKEIKEVLFSQIMYILKTCTLKMVVIRVSSECNYFKKQRIKRIFMINGIQNNIAHYHGVTTIYQRVWIEKQPKRVFVGGKARTK